MGRQGHADMRYLFTLSLGPVQGFIAAARRTRDLWAGSWLLSEVSKAVAQFLHRNGATLIFPNPLTDSDLAPNSKFTVVNKILASVETDEPAGLASAAKEAARKRLFEAASQLEDLRGTTFDQESFEGQLQEFLEFYCAWAPQGEDANYAQDRQRCELLFLARKSLNDFPSHKGTPGVPKSSLDGARENVVQHRGRHLFQSQLKDNEYLDAIGLVKRFTRTPERSRRFESTLAVAAVPYILGVQKNPKCEQALAEYVQFLGQLKLAHETGSLLYEHESRQIFDFEKDKAEFAELERLRKIIYEAHREPNPPYYALLIADGDHMGKAIDSIDKRDRHQEFSRCLSKFADKAARLIDGEPYSGCRIYVGGDDVMALLPLHQAIECVIELRNLFIQKMPGMTFSAGLAVVHALEPLTEAREIAQRAEKLAKHTAGRDALAIIHAPRSGPDTLAYGKFDVFPGLLLRIIGYYESKTLSLGFAHELRNLLESSPPAVDPVIVEMARGVAAKKQEDKAALDLLKGLSSREQLANLYSALLIARPFFRAKKEAGL
jgi:CRISPR-associated protein Cmr2